MKLQSITEISKAFGISTRTLRYYEQIGLIRPTKKEDFAYRTYDEDTIARLRQIIVLRKLRIPLRKIADIIESKDASAAIDAFQQNLVEIDDEITALSTIKSIIQALLERLHLKSDEFYLPDDESLLEMADDLMAAGEDAQEERGMERLQKSGELAHKAPEVMVIHIHPFKAVTTGLKTDNELWDALSEWLKTHGQLIKKQPYGAFSFVQMETNLRCEWIGAAADGVTDAAVEPYQLTEFEGGLYASAVHIVDDNASMIGAYKRIKKWLKTSGFEEDTRPGHGLMLDHISAPNDMRMALGYCQAVLYVPIKIRAEKSNPVQTPAIGELDHVDRQLSRIIDQDIRIVQLPASDVAAIRYEGDDAEERCRQALHAFINEHDLLRVKPDIRRFCFHAPRIEGEHYTHGYEMWVTIPEGFTAEAPFVKKTLGGGMYAAYMVPADAAEEWEWVYSWIKYNGKYSYRGNGEDQNMYDSLEETIDFASRMQLADPFGEGCQIDLLMPIKEIRIVAVYTEHFNDLRLIGKKYGKEDFDARWDEWYANDWFSPLERLGPASENDGAPLGAAQTATGKLEYWIGMLFAPGTAVPEGYDYVDIPARDVAVCQIQGKNRRDLHSYEAHCLSLETIKKHGHTGSVNGWCFERYTSPRFTVPDAQGSVILDYCVTLEPAK